ncbi:MAG: 1-acyl-sn-glycerol-3-phosphate acyltransferase [Actinomycetota bacterium]|nr:1-acyl-sn-glycerol-3-phosphate acyltransferase [Actinomycetota bacterium]
MSEGSRARSKTRGGPSRNGAGANGADTRARKRRNGRAGRPPASAAKPASTAGGGPDSGELLPSLAGDAVALAGRGLGAIARLAQARVPKADLDERDPDYIRESLPGLWLLASLWFRGEVRGLGRIPAEGPVLMVGNHSGGNVTPDTIVFTLAFNTYFGVERRFYQLAHNLVLSMPGLGYLRKYGTVAASPENAKEALDSGAALLVYPGGDWEVHRPSWESAKVDFGGRKGFIRLALEKDVPVVGVVSIGGQETALFLSRGEWLARLLRLDKLFRLKVLPISVAIPWGLNIGDMLGHLPGPSKITIQVLPPIDLRERYGSAPDVDEVYTDLMEQMQDTLTALASERTLPVIG